MGGLFGGGSRAPQRSEADIAAERRAAAAQERAEERASAQERSEMQAAQARRRVRRTGGMRILFSPARQEGPGGGRYTKLGGD